MNGYHSIDLVYNSTNVSYDISKSTDFEHQSYYNFDKTISGRILDLQSVYSNGWKQIFLGTIFLLFSSYNIGNSTYTENYKYKYC